MAPSLVAVPPAPSEKPVSPDDSDLNFKGYILPVQKVLISPKVSGIILKLYVHEGCRVRKGDVLAELEDVDYRADYQRAQSYLEETRQRLAEIEGSQSKDVGQAQADLERAQIEATQLQSDFLRVRELYLKDNAVSKLEYETAQSRYREAQQQARSLEFALARLRLSLDKRLVAARAQVDEAVADVVKTRWKLENCEVRAPSEGTILKKNAEEGNLVNPVAFNDTFSLCELANLSQLEVELTIKERDIHRVRPGQKCKIRTEAFPERSYDGILARFMPVASRLLSAIAVRVRINVPKDEEGVYLRPDMTAMVSFLPERATAGPPIADKPSPSVPRALGAPAASGSAHLAIHTSG